jgi:hypothetical protein
MKHKQLSGTAKEKNLKGSGDGVFLAINKVHKSSYSQRKQEIGELKAIV